MPWGRQGPSWTHCQTSCLRAKAWSPRGCACVSWQGDGAWAGLEMRLVGEGEGEGEGVCGSAALGFGNSSSRPGGEQQVSYTGSST